MSRARSAPKTTKTPKSPPAKRASSTGKAAVKRPLSPKKTVRKASRRKAFASLVSPSPSLSPPPSLSLSPPPTPRVTIDARLFPHIMDDILAYASPEALLALRAANRQMKALVDSVMPMHVRVVQYSPPEFKNAKLAEKHPVGTTKGVALLAASEPDPTAWIYREGVGMFATLEEKVARWEKERTAAAVDVMKYKAEFEALEPLALYEDASIYKRQGIITRGRSAFEYFAPFAPKGAVSKAKSALPAFNPKPPVDVAEKRFADLVDKVHQSCMDWKHYKRLPSSLADIIPTSWGLLSGYSFNQYGFPANQGGSMIARRPYIIDILTLAAPGGYYSNLRSCYVRHGPFVETGYSYSANTFVLVLTLGDEALRGFIPLTATNPIVALRINPGKAKSTIITSGHGHPMVKSITLIITPHPKLGAAKHFSMMTSIFRDLVDLLGKSGTLTVVNAEALPFEWLGVHVDGESAEHTTTAWMDTALTQIVKEHNKSLVKAGGRNPKKGTVSYQLMTKDAYMKKKGIGEVEYAIERGD